MSPGVQAKGCYANVRIRPNESLAGYLLRVAERNGYRGIRHFLSTVGIRCGTQISDEIRHLMTTPTALERLGEVTVSDRKQLLAHLADPLPPGAAYMEAIFWQDCRIDLDALSPYRAPVCPHCIKLGMADWSWEIAPVVACCTHRTYLVDVCSCGAPIDWNRPSLAHCAGCGRRLGDLPSEDAPDDVIAATEDFKALAPFWVGSQESRRVEQWDDLIRVFKLLLLPPECVLRWEWPRRLVSRSAVVDRAKAIRTLSSCRTDNAIYDISNLCGALKEWFSPLKGLPVPLTLERHLACFMIGEVGLSAATTDELLGANVVVEPPTAVALFAGRPPIARTVQQLARAYSIPESDARALLHLGLVGLRQKSHLGFDADEILRGQSFLDRLLDLTRLSQVAGVPVEACHLNQNGLLPRWNRYNPNDPRVHLDRLIEVQLRLIQAFRSTIGDELQPRLGDLAALAHDPTKFILDYVARLAEGSIAMSGWDLPYAWADMRVKVAP